MQSPFVSLLMKRIVEFFEHPLEENLIVLSIFEGILNLESSNKSYEIVLNIKKDFLLTMMSLL